MYTNQKYDIYERCFVYAAKTAEFIRVYQKDFIIMEYAKQLIRSSSSIGANMQEADCAVTKRDFINKVGIARKEAKESLHWLRLIQTFNVCRESNQLEWLLKENHEIVLILSKIFHKTKGN